MIATDCPSCGEPVSTFAKSCAHCGAPNPARRAGFLVAGALVLLLVAVAVATTALLRWHRTSVPDGTATTAPGEDFGWLSTAMRDCDTDAAKNLDTLYFLVIPLKAVTGDDESWRKRSLNDIGNATLLNSEVALDSLKDGSLQLSSEQYVFAIRDDKTSTIYKWSPSSGAKRFSTADSDAIDGFKVQFVTRQKSDDSNWGAIFTRRKGNCYRVNAIIGR
jgi:hypothetical protein